ncbi:MAG: hypothetical protein U0T82_07695 [Bacteroidales bacterium]
MKNRKHKIFTLDKLTDKYSGKPCIPKREEFELILKKLTTKDTKNFTEEYHEGKSKL